MNNAIGIMKGLTGYLGMKEAASYIGITVGTLYQWVSHGKVRTYKAGKFNAFKVEDLEAAKMPRLRVVSKRRSAR